MLMNLASLVIFTTLSEITIVVGEGKVKIDEKGRLYGDRAEEAIESATHFTVGGVKKNREEMQTLLTNMDNGLREEADREDRRKEMKDRIRNAERNLCNSREGLEMSLERIQEHKNILEMFEEEVEERRLHVESYEEELRKVLAEKEALERELEAID